MLIVTVRPIVIFQTKSLSSSREVRIIENLNGGKVKINTDLRPLK